MLNPSVEEVDIIIASFGVISKLTTNKIYKLDMVRHIVLDEADALFHETFEDKLKVFLNRVPVCLNVVNYMQKFTFDRILHIQLCCFQFGYAQNSDDSKLPLGALLTLASATMPSRMQEILKDIINVDSALRIKIAIEIAVE